MKLELAQKEMFMLFPTVLFTGTVSDIAACDRIEVKLRDMQKLNQGGTAKSGQYAFMTRDNLQALAEMKELVDLIMKESGAILDAYKIKRDSHYITNMWANIANPNRRHAMHVHPNCLFSGILYIRAPKNCGSTVFSSPRMLARMIEPAFTEKTNSIRVCSCFPQQKAACCCGRAIFRTRSKSATPMKTRTESLWRSIS